MSIEGEVKISGTEAARILAAERRIHTGNCAHCGAEFQGTTKRKYCKHAHSQAAYYERARKRRGGLIEIKESSGELSITPPTRPSSLALFIDLQIASLPVEKQTLAIQLISKIATQVIRVLDR